MKKKQADEVGQRVGLAVLGLFIIFLTFLGGMYWYVRSKVDSLDSGVAGEMAVSTDTNTEKSQTSSESWSEADKERLAKFLNEKGVVLYYSSDCVFCHRQLEMFGDSQKYLRAVDCYLERTSVCKEIIEKEERVPNWKYKGETKVGVRELDELADWVGFKK